MPEKSEPFAPITFWIANPQSRLRIYRPGNPVPLTFRNGQLRVTSQADADAVRQRADVFEEDYSERQIRDGRVRACPHCGYRPRSLAAYQAHEELHPVQPR